jgi:hypothetical protein
MQEKREVIGNDRCKGPLGSGEWVTGHKRGMVRRTVLLMSGDPLAGPRGALTRAVSSNLSLACLFPSWPVCSMPPLSYWLPGLARSRPYSPLVQSGFLPWLTGSYISNRFHARGLLIALMMEAARTSEMLINFYQTTLRYNPEDSHLRTHCCENLKSY